MQLGPIFYGYHVSLLLRVAALYATCSYKHVQKKEKEKKKMQTALLFLVQNGGCVWRAVEVSDCSSEACSNALLSVVVCGVYSTHTL